jgi:alkylation response protein AidB-like acyl-CoA dehydrogenase
MATTDGTFVQARTILTALERTLERALAHTRQTTQAGQDIDGFQWHCERLAYRATELRAAQDILHYAETLESQGQDHIGLLARTDPNPRKGAEHRETHEVHGGTQPDWADGETDRLLR